MVLGVASSIEVGDDDVAMATLVVVEVEVTSTGEEDTTSDTVVKPLMELASEDTTMCAERGVAVLSMEVVV